VVPHCRLAERPIDDLERLAVWCREGTPADAVFVGPPGPKSFRLWSRRSLAFNRAGSPYHAAGLADWSRRFREHVGYPGSLESFVEAYLKGRHALEGRYEARTDADLAALARSQGARFVLTETPREAREGSPLRLLRREGDYAVWEVTGTRPELAVSSASTARR
jgi:hypothetical protein